MAVTLWDFIEVWQALDRNGRKKAFRFLLEVYGKENLLNYLQGVRCTKTDSELSSEKK